ncbi:putative ribonuclease H-like domain-containing protein [Tanacetum coccineum]
MEEQKPVINLYLTKLIMSGSDADAPPPPPPPPSQTPSQQTPHTVSTIKLPILKKGEYDIWAMKMEHYLAHTDYPIWEVIQRGNGPVSVSTDTNGLIKVLPPKTAEETLARERERKARTTLLMALPEDHLAKFHKMTDAKENVSESSESTRDSWCRRRFPLKEQLEFLRSSSHLPDHEDLEQLDEFDLEEMDLKWQSQGIRKRDNGEKTGKTEDSKAWVTLDEKVFDWTIHSNMNRNYLSWLANNLVSDTEREQLGDASIEIQAYTQALKKVEAQLVAHQQVSAVKGKRETAVKSSAGCNWRPQRHTVHKVTKNNSDQYYHHKSFDRTKAFPVAFGGSKGYITGKGKIKIGKLDFKNVCFMKELQHFNLFSVSQICDKKNKVPFTDSECLVLSPEFKLPNANQVLLRIPRQTIVTAFKLENIVPFGGLSCLIAKATIDESNKWHRRLGHVNFKNLNKLVKGNLVRGLPSKLFQNDHTYVACQKGKQHKASCKAKSVSFISQPLQLLHMDLFGPTSVRSLNHKTYCLVITDDFSRFSWVFFLRTKDETSGILKDFIRQIENQLNQKVKTIRCDNGTEFKNSDFIEFCGSKGIKREYSNARTPQQNGVAERKNRTLIEAARTMLADSFLPNTFRL